MSFLNRLLKRICGQSRLYRTRRRRSLSPFGVLAAQVETLEVRALLSSAYEVDSLTDTGAGSGLTGDIRYCIAQADQSANAGSTITFDPALTGSTISLSHGQLVISDAMTITGPGASSLTLSGNNSSRLFDVASGGSLTLENVTLSGGLAQGIGAAAEGGAIYSSGTLALGGVTVTSNEALGSNGTGENACGGGIYVAAGSVTLTNDTLSSNHAVGGSGGAGATSSGAFFGAGGSGGAGSGGGLYVAAGTVTLDNDTLSSNQAVGGNGGPGGGAAGATSSGVVLGPYGSGGAGSGGGLYAAAGSVTLNNDTLSSNQAVGGSGGNGYYVWTGGNGVPQGGSGGSGGAGSGGGLYVAAGAVTLNYDTLSSNQAVGGNGGQGGGGGGTAYGGRFLSGGGGPAGTGSGGGLYAAAGSVTLTNDTLGSNQAVGGNVGKSGGGIGAAFGGAAFGGGIDNAAGPDVLQIYDTILADNSASTTGPDLDGGLTSLGFNLIGNSTGGSGFAASDLLNVNPLLGPLQNNGGPTQTMALLPGSPAIDAGDNANAPAYDQRGPGFARVVNGTIDIGAFELQTPSTTTPVVSRVSPAYGPSAGGTTVTISGANLGTAATATVDFGSNNPATIVSDNGTRLVVVDPAGSGTVDVTVTTANGTSATSSPDQFTFFSPITVSSSTLPAATANQSYSATITAGGGSGSYTFALASGSSLPAGLKLSSSGTLAGSTPTAGSYTFTIVASDTVYTGVTGSQQYTLAVNPASTLTLSPTSLPTATVSDSYGPVTITASGGSSSYTFALASGNKLPAGLTLTSAGVVSGKPTTATGSPFGFTIIATDKSNSGLTGSAAYTLTVDPAITLSPATLPVATVADGVNDKLTAKGGSGTGYTFALASGSSLPSGLTLTSAGAITGTPTQSGKYAFTIVATDSTGATGSQAYSLTIDPAITIKPTQLPAATIRRKYTESLTASGGSGTGYSWSASGLPTWLTLTTSGTLTGTPRRGAPSHITFTVTVTDSNKGTDIMQFTLSIK